MSKRAELPIRSAPAQVARVAPREGGCSASMKRRLVKQKPADAFEIVRTVGLALPEVEATTKYDGARMCRHSNLNVHWTLN